MGKAPVDHQDILKHYGWDFEFEVSGHSVKLGDLLRVLDLPREEKEVVWDAPVPSNKELNPVNINDWIKELDKKGGEE